jgi:hypothetical protein
MNDGKYKLPPMCGNSADRQSVCSFLGQLFWKVISGKGPKNSHTVEEKDFFKHRSLPCCGHETEHSTSQRLPWEQENICLFKNFNIPIEEFLQN